MTAARLLVALLPLATPASPGRADDPPPGQGAPLDSAPVAEPEAVDPGRPINGLFRAGPIYLAGQPDPEILRGLVADGVTVVVNLRPPEEMESVEFDEPSLLESLGVDYVSIPIGAGPYAPRLEALDRLKDALASHEGKALIHCSHAIRASRIWAAHLVRDRGIPRAQVDAYTRITTGMPAMVERYLGDEEGTPE